VSVAVGIGSESPEMTIETSLINLKQYQYRKNHSWKQRLGKLTKKD